MSGNISFKSLSLTHRHSCLALFDANCPEFFAPNERSDYETFLNAVPAGYEVCLVGDEIVGAFGLIGSDPGCANLNWILLDPKSQGRGIGSAIMKRVVESARAAGIAVIRIAASHKSAPFFARFGAVAVRSTPDGWGPGMHRIDMELLP